MAGENYQIYTFQITGNAFVNECAEGVLQIQSPVCGVIFSNNILPTQVSINETETELESTFGTS